jgi:hypothetical protein
VGSIEKGKNIADLIKELSTKIGTIEGGTNLAKEIEALKTLIGNVPVGRNLADIIGDVPATKDLMDLIGKVPDGSNLVGLVQTLDTALSDLTSTVDNPANTKNHEKRIPFLETNQIVPYDLFDTTLHPSTNYKVASFSFTGTGIVTNINDDFVMTAATSVNNVHTYTINIQNSLFTSAPIISVSLSDPSPDVDISILVVYTRSITATSFQIVVDNPRNSVSALPTYIVEAILYGN